jgi:hypothetical protein
MQLILPTQILTYAQLLEWDKNDLAEFILNHTMITHAEDEDLKEDYNNEDLKIFYLK